MIQRLFILTILPLFLTACSATITATNTPANITDADYDSFVLAAQAADEDNENKRLTLPANTVQSTIVGGGTPDTVVNYTKDLKIIFDYAGDIIEVTVADKNDRTHSLSKTGNFSETSLSGGITSGTLAVNRYFDGSVNSYNFTSQYMISGVITYAPDSDTDNHIYLIAGMETAGNHIPQSDDFVTFNGAGQGKHYSSSTTEDIYFDVTATVDFTQRNVSLTTERSCVTNSYSCSDANSRNHLNFTAQALSYEPNINEITGNDIETDGFTDDDDATNNIEKLTGSADARFYGRGGQGGDELGGTFNVSNDDAHYVGFFGAKK
ncbi:MAG: hypothetical protein K0U45_04640 [Alphaproteobacteria bacterium]|nr:hypothetical protein [Alphaproteobacteria bacterium]